MFNMNSLAIELAIRLSDSYVMTNNVETVIWGAIPDVYSVECAGEKENPEACFALWDLMEKAGYRIAMQDRLDNKEFPRAAYLWLCKSEEDRKRGLGKTRIEAMVKLFVATMPVIRSIEQVKLSP